MRFAERRDAARGSLAGLDADVLVVSNLSNVRYLSGFSGSNGAVLLGQDPRHDRLVTDFRYLTQAAAESPDLELVVERAVVAAAVGRAEATGAGRVAFEADHVSVSLHAAVVAAHRDVAFVPSSGIVEVLRATKDDDELALLAEACRISDAALGDLLPQVRVGLTERQVARLLDSLMLEHGAEAVAFDTIVASGPHSAIPHHSPTDRTIEAGDLLKIDFGARHGGYHADETRTFVVGREPAAWQREIHDLVAVAQQAGVDALAVGAGLRDVDHASRSVIAAAGHAEHFGHGLGHGVGLDIHEAPLIGHASTGILGDRTPVTVEPGVYLPGRGGVRIEDTLVVRTGGPVSLTQTTRDLLVL